MVQVGSATAVLSSCRRMPFPSPRDHPSRRPLGSPSRSRDHRSSPPACRRPSWAVSSPGLAQGMSTSVASADRAIIASTSWRRPPRHRRPSTRTRSSTGPRPGYRRALPDPGSLPSALPPTGGAAAAAAAAAAAGALPAARVGTCGGVGGVALLPAPRRQRQHPEGGREPPEPDNVQAPAVADHVKPRAAEPRELQAPSDQCHRTAAERTRVQDRRQARRRPPEHERAVGLPWPAEPTDGAGSLLPVWVGVLWVRAWWSTWARAHSGDGTRALVSAAGSCA